MPAWEAHPRAVDVGAGGARSRSSADRVVVDLDADLLEDRVGVVLDDGEPLLGHELERRAVVRVRNGSRADDVRRRAPPGARPVRRSGVRPLAVARGPSCRSSTPPCRSRARRRRPSRSPARDGAGAAPGSVDHAGQVGRRRRGVGERHRGDEQLLEARLGGGLDLGHPADRGCSISRALRARHAAPAPRRRRRRCRPSAPPSTRAVGHEAEHHRVAPGRCGAERAGEADVGAASVKPGVLHEQVDAGAQRGLGQLDGAHVVLGDRQPRRRRRRTARSANVRPSATTWARAAGGVADGSCRRRR